jgi:hypothetical protein
MKNIEIGELMSLLTDAPIKSLASVAGSDAQLVHPSRNSLSLSGVVWHYAPDPHLEIDAAASFAELIRWNSRNSICSVELNVRQPILLDWVSSRLGALNRLTAFELQQHAGSQLSHLIAAGLASPSESALRSLNTVVGSFVRDGGPTPQLAATSSKSIEVAWVAGPTAVGAVFSQDGTYSVWAQDQAGNDLFDEDVDDAMPQALHDRITAMLSEMSPLVLRSVPLG